MDFIEGIFGIAPDGGSGLFEILLFLLPIAGIVVLRARYKREDSRRNEMSEKM
ncbi:MAG: hypothetical protein ACM3TN_25635 [Alphaproteobacteria bacterium]